MDVNVLHSCFAATLQQDQAVRTQAEQKLKQLEVVPGFLGGCLDILSNEQVEHQVKKACAVFFKNRITKYWGKEGSKVNAIDNDEKPIIKERLISAMVECPSQIKNQLYPVLSTIINFDYPSKWPQLIGQCFELLQSNDINSIYAGILCFSEVARKYRWVGNDDRPELDEILMKFSPILLSIGNHLLSQDDFESGDIVKLILKIYKFVTYNDLPVYLQSQDQLVAWGTFHVNVIYKVLPDQVMNIDESERKLFTWVKSQKWAYANLYRLFMRYGASSLTRKFDYPEFKAVFMQNLIPSLVGVYLETIEKWCVQKVWLSNDSIYYMLQFFSHMVTQKSTWPLIQSHIESLLQHFIYPILCPDDPTLELFENDPQEYIHMNFDIYEDTNSADVAASSFLLTLVDKRKKSTLEPILMFSYNKLSELMSKDETLESAKQKEGALRLISSVSHHLVTPNSPYVEQMEPFLANLVFPNFNSKFSFLRARTCDVSCSFSDLKFNHQANLGVLYKGVMESFSDENIPTQLEAALAIQAFMRIPEFEEALTSIIVPTMQKLLELSDNIDNDAISGVMQECVEVFATELQPFGVDLMTKLVEQFMRLAREVNEVANLDVEDYTDDVEDTSEKTMAALGILNTIITVLLSFENSAEICVSLETVFSPIIEFVLTSGLDDFFTEIAELIENSTFLIRSISPIMWKNFELLSNSFESGIALMYIEEFMPAINNYLVYGKDQLKQNELYQTALLRIFVKVFECEDEGLNDIICACQLAHTYILSLEHSSVPVIPQYLQRVLQIMDSEDASQSKNLSFIVNLYDVILSAMIYDTENTLNTLQGASKFQIFVQEWFKLIPSLKRVFDIKLSLLALLGLANCSSPLINEELLAEVGKMVALLLGKLPDAIKSLATKRKEFDGGEFNESQGGDESNWENEEEEFEDEGNADEYLEFLQSEASKLRTAGFFDEDDEEVAEDPLATTPLDGINSFKVFKDTYLHLKDAKPVVYELLVRKLTMEDESAIAQAVVLADES